MIRCNTCYKELLPAEVEKHMQTQHGAEGSVFCLEHFEKFEYLPDFEKHVREKHGKEGRAL